MSAAPAVAEIEVGQVWETGERAVVVVSTGAAGVRVRDSYGWLRSMTTDELEHGFSLATGGRAATRRVMGRRSLADIEPA